MCILAACKKDTLERSTKQLRKFLRIQLQFPSNLKDITAEHSLLIKVISSHCISNSWFERSVRSEPRDQHVFLKLLKLELKKTDI
jgi:hypothetical protein